MDGIATFDLGLNDIFNDDDGLDKILIDLDDSFISKDPSSSNTALVSNVPKDLLMSSQEEREIMLSVKSKRKLEDVSNHSPKQAKSEPQSSKQELLSFVRTNRNVNTVKKTNREVLKFIKHLGDKGEKRQLTKIPPDELDIYLGHYIKDLQKENGGTYEPDSISSYIR